ncbi:uncharacterized protein LOC111107352 [Crassostrea virginica]
MAGTITSVSFLNDSKIPRDYHDSNSLTKTSALSKIKECEDVKVNRIVHTDGNKLSNKSSVTDKKTKGRVHQGLTEKKTKTDTSKATTTQKVVKDPKKSKVGSKLLTQRSLSDDTPQQMRVRETRERRRDSDVNCNSHYLLEYRRRLRQMSVNRFLSEEQIHQFINNTVLPHHRALTSHQQKTAPCLAPNATSASPRGVETGLPATPLTPAHFTEVGSSSKQCLPSYRPEGAGLQSLETPGAAGRAAALVGGNSFLSNEQIKQFITSTVLPHHRLLTSQQSNFATNAKQHRQSSILVEESNRQPVVQVPGQIKYSPLGAEKLGTVGDYQETRGENSNGNGLNSQESPSDRERSLLGQTSSGVIPIQSAMLKAARTNSTDTLPLVANPTPANRMSPNGVSANHVIANGISGNIASGSGATANRTHGNGVSANYISDNGLSANSASANRMHGNAVSANGVSTNDSSASKISANDVSASQHYQHNTVSHTQSLSVIHRTVTNVLKKDATGQNGEQATVDRGSAQGFSLTLSNPSQTESAVHDSTVGQPDCKKNENENPVVNNKVEKCRQTPKRRGKDPKSPGTVGKRRKVVSNSPGADNQLCQESQENTDSHKELLTQSLSDEDFEESIKEFFEALKLQNDVPFEGPRTLLRPLVDPENIIPCDDFYIDLSLFL